MVKAVEDLVLDQTLNYIKNQTTAMKLCSAQPTTYAEANATYALASVVMAPTDIIVGPGDTNGRKAAVAAKAGVSVATTGTGDHVALVNTAGTALLYVTTCGSQAVGSGGTVDFGTWDIEIADPV